MAVCPALTATSLADLLRQALSQSLPEHLAAQARTALQGGPSAKSGAVISAAPVRTNRQVGAGDDEDDESGAATAAQIAMLGGQWKPNAEPPEEPRIGPAELGQVS